MYHTHKRSLEKRKSYMDKVERITHAAIVGEGGTMIFLGKSHADCYKQACATGCKTSDQSKHQGFMTSAGRYVPRTVAAQIAFNAGQIKKNSGALISEELWYDKDGGMFKYDSIKGYYKD